MIKEVLYIENIILDDFQPVGLVSLAASQLSYLFPFDLLEINIIQIHPFISEWFKNFPMFYMACLRNKQNMKRGVRKNGIRTLPLGDKFGHGS